MNSVGIGTRVFTFLIDSIFVFLLTYAAYRSWTWYVFYYKSTYLPFYVFWFIVTFLYYLFLRAFGGARQANGCRYPK